MKDLNVLFISSEIEPYAKSGGLADVSSALPKALATKEGIKVKSVMPLYSSINREKYGLTKILDSVCVHMGNCEEWFSVYHTNKPYGTDVYFIEFNKYFERKGLYHDAAGEFGDNVERFSFFCKAALQTAKDIGFQPDILHCNDWQTSFAPYYVKCGEDGFFSDDFICDIITRIKASYPDCAITLSLGERSKASYKRLFDAGANRYLLRHETYDEKHYSLLHPESMSFENRISCLKNLKEIGYQTGCGFMVGSPCQTNANIAKDLKFIEQFKPDMCGLGPFIPHKATKFASCPQGTVELTCYLLSIIRLIHPHVLLPATTALGSIDENGREKGILSGANVIMPNLSPSCVRAKYEIYNNKLFSGSESAQELQALKARIKNIGYEIVTDRGDIKK